MSVGQTILRPRSAMTGEAISETQASSSKPSLKVRTMMVRR